MIRSAWRTHRKNRRDGVDLAIRHFGIWGRYEIDFYMLLESSVFEKIYIIEAGSGEPPHADGTLNFANGDLVQVPGNYGIVSPFDRTRRCW